MKNLRLKYKLYILIAILIFPMILLQTLQIYKLYTYSIESELKSNNDFAEAINTSFMNYIEKTWDTELSMGLALCFDKVSPSEDMNMYMENMLKSQPSVLEYGWVDPVSLNITYSSASKAIGQSVADREYIGRILKGEEKVVSNLMIPHGLDSPSFIIARAIRQNGDLKGILIAAINVKKLDSIFPKNRISESSSFGIVDKNGIIIYRNGFNDVADRQVSISTQSYFQLALESGQSVNIKKIKSLITGKEIMSSYQPVSQISWVTYGCTSYDEVMSYVITNIKNAVIIFVITTIILILLAFKILRQILYPINTLKEAANKISSGKFSIRTNISGNDEIAKTAQAFDKMLEYIEDYNKLKTEFFSNLSHELKTPLNIILSSLQLLDSFQVNEQSTHNQEKNKKYFKMIRQNCYRLLRLINNLIDISKVDSGFMKFNYGYYNIITLVEDITLSVVGFAESKGIEVIFDTDIEEKAVLCDPDKIERIILNLLSNSIKFTPEGGSIYVNIYDKDDTVVINIKDTGIGIEENKLKVIFDRFTQVDSALQRKYEGSGIGLSLVKSLVEAHCGNITVNSSPGKGSTFLIELPSSNVDLDEESNKYTNKHTFDTVQMINIEFSDIYSE